MTPSEQSYLEIPLTQNQFAKVSPHRFEELSKRSWHAQWHPGKKSFYATTNLFRREGGKMSPMHRLIMGVVDPTIAVDHINGDSLDNRDENLRTCTGAENAKNRKRNSNNSSGFKGVTRKKRSYGYLWCARIMVSRECIHLGYFPDTKEGLIMAARAYDEAAIKYFGEFSRLNFPITQSEPA